MTGLPRLMPAPPPPVAPVYEYLAEGRTAAIYGDIKQVLGAPWVGVLMLAYARYPQFFETLWEGLKPIARSAAFVEGATALRDFAEETATALNVRSLDEDLHSLGYSGRELGQIRAVIETLSAGNFPYVLIATIARMMMEGAAFADPAPVAAPVAAVAAAAAAAPQPAAAEPSAFVMIEEHHANGELRALYGRIKQAVGLPFVNTDYRALARWPSYFERAWTDLEPNLETESYESHCRAIHTKALSVAMGLPNPAGLAPDRLLAAAAEDGGVDEIRDVCRLFQYLLPGLVLNVACFRRQLHP